jgi:hypothetical protein
MQRLSWICALLLGAAWLLPLHVLPWMSWHNEFVAFVAVLLACAGALALGRRWRGEVSVPSLAWLPALIGGFAVFQWVAGRIVFAGSLFTILSYALLCVAAATVGRASVPGHDRAPVPALRVLAQCLAVAGALQLFVVFSQTLWTWGGSDWVARTAYATRGGGNVAQPNQAALLFVLAMAATLYLRQP